MKVAKVQVNKQGFINVYVDNELIAQFNRNGQRFWVTYFDPKKLRMYASLEHRPDERKIVLEYETDDGSVHELATIEY